MSLNKKVYQVMQDLTPVVVSTSVNNKPYTTFISWAIAKDEDTIRIAVSTNAKTTENIRANPNVCLELFDKDLAVSISGQAKIITEQIEGIPFPVAVIEIKITEIVDNLFPGATITGKIPFTHTGNVEKAEELDKKVLEALRA